MFLVQAFFLKERLLEASLSTLTPNHFGEHIQTQCIIPLSHLLRNLGDHATPTNLKMVDLAVFEQQVNWSELMIEFCLLHSCIEFFLLDYVLVQFPVERLLFLPGVRRSSSSLSGTLWCLPAVKNEDLPSEIEFIDRVIERFYILHAIGKRVVIVGGNIQIRRFSVFIPR